jgi:hypothetical protein
MQKATKSAGQMNMLQLAEVYLSVDAAGRNTQIKHGKEKEIFNLEPFMWIGRFYIPRACEMGRKKKTSAPGNHQCFSRPRDTLSLKASRRIVTPVTRYGAPIGIRKSLLRWMYLEMM